MSDAAWTNTVNICVDDKAGRKNAFFISVIKIWDEFFFFAFQTPAIQYFDTLNFTRSFYKIVYKVEKFSEL